jgi:hypothetical protein
MEVDTFWANIYVGQKNRDTGEVYPLDIAFEICQKYVDEVGLCVTITPTEYVYTDGGESGFVVGLINYPRFPSSPEVIRGHALELGRRLLDEYRQYRVSIVFPDKTYMISREEE